MTNPFIVYVVGPKNKDSNGSNFIIWSVIHTFDRSVIDCCHSYQHHHGSQHLRHSNPLPLSSLSLGLALSRAVAFSLIITDSTPASPPHSSSRMHPLPHHPGCLHPPAYWREEGVPCFDKHWIVDYGLALSHLISAQG